MGHDKLRKFAENETFSCLLQPSAQELLTDGYFHLRDHAVKGRWKDFFSDRAADSAVPPENRATLGIVRGGTASEVWGPRKSQICGVQQAQRWGRAQRDVFRGELPNCEQEKKLILELGCGKGEYTIALAERNPEQNYIGVDIKGARLWKGAKYATEHRLPNVAFLRTRVEFITAFFAPGEVSEVWLTFSDPQYRSENSRLCSPLFLERYRSFLRPGGIVHLKTDSRFLHEYALAVCRCNNLQILACTSDLYGMSDCGDKAGAAVAPANRATLGIVRGGTASEVWGPRKSQICGVQQAQRDVCRGELPSSQTQADIPNEVREVQTFYEQLFLEQGYPITYLSFVIDHEGPYVSPRDPEEFDSKAWRAAEGPRLLFGHDSAETRRQKLHAGAESD